MGLLYVLSFSISLFLIPFIRMPHLSRSVLMLLLLFGCISKIRLYIEHAHRTFIHTTSNPHYFYAFQVLWLIRTQYDLPITFLMAKMYEHAKRRSTYASITRTQKGKIVKSNCRHHKSQYWRIRNQRYRNKKGRQPHNNLLRCVFFIERTVVVPIFMDDAIDVIRFDRATFV